MNKKIFVLPGDGIGPEVIGEVRKIINWFNDKKSLDFEIQMLVRYKQVYLQVGMMFGIHFFLINTEFYKYVYMGH